MIQYNGQDCFSGYAEAAAYYGVKHRCVARWVAQGKLKAHRPTGAGPGAPAFIPLGQPDPRAIRVGDLRGEA